MKFTLTIKLGNDAMQTLDDVFCSFKKSIRGLADAQTPLAHGDSDSLRDANGNTVGQWKVTE